MDLNGPERTSTDLTALTALNGMATGAVTWAKRLTEQQFLTGDTRCI
jgi:hypothetical protein